MQPVSAQDFGTLLVRTRLVTDAEVNALHERWQAAGGTASGEAAAFARWLVKEQYLTSYQADRLLRGHADHYFFGPYKLLDRIGQGRMAGVFKAVHRLGQVVAIKVLPPSKARDPQALRRFRREARLALRLKHPNVVRTFQTGAEGELQYLVMEYLEGETLEDVLKRRGRLPVAEAVRVVHQALQGLQHLHEQKMVHRDLKPANLMLVSEQATVKILDIGVGRDSFDENDPGASEADPLTVRGDLLGSPDYMAPEQAKDAHTADIRADIYSLGCVLYHALSGQVPFPEKNLVRQIVRHASETARPLKDLNADIPDALQRIVTNLMAKAPTERYATPKQAAAALQAFLDRRQGPAAVSEAAQAAQRKLQEYEAWLQAHDPDAGWLGRGNLRRFLVAGAGVAAACLLLAFGAGIWLGRHDKPAAGPDVAAPGTAADRQTLADWANQLAMLPPESQVEAVAAKLKERNPEFDGAVQHTIQEGVVTDLEFNSDQVSDLAPVRALGGLKRLCCAGSGPGKGKVADLTPLEGLRLAVFDCGFTNVSDLSPLRGMPLEFVSLGGTQVRDLSPLRGAPLVVVNCAGTHVGDVAPLEGMALTLLDAADAPIADLSPLRKAPLEVLWCDLLPQRDLELLRSMGSLKEINGKSTADALKQLEAAQRNAQAWARRVAGMPPEEQVKAVVAELKKRNPGFDGTVTPKIEQGKVVELRLVSDAVTDLSPLQALPGLSRLFCNGSQPGKGSLASLQGLKGLRLTELDCGWTRVRDLEPLRGMPLARLGAAGNPGLADLTPLQKLPLTWLQLDGDVLVEDLTPLRGRPLTSLHLAGTGVRNLEPLRGMKLTSLAIHGAPVLDLTPLQGLPLESLSFDFKPERHSALLRSLKHLERVNGKPADEALQESEAEEREFAAVVQRIAALSAAEQVKVVAAELQKRNPGFDGTVDFKTDVKGGVMEVRLRADRVTDLYPLRALTTVRKVVCTGSASGKGALYDLSPLTGMASLTAVDVSATAVVDLTSLRGLPLTELNLAETPVRDLAALAKMPLERLNLTHTQVVDRTPIKDLPLQHFRCDNLTAADLDMLGQMKTLLTVNDKPLKDNQPVAQTAIPNPAAGAVVRKMVPTLNILGELVGVDRGNKSITLRLRGAVLVQSEHHTFWYQYHRLKAVEAQLIRNPRERLRRIQDQLFWMNYHAARMFRWHARDQDLVLRIADDCQVRVRQLPITLDERGRPRSYSKQELADLKGKDPTLPGYRAELSTLAAPQAVQITVAPADRIKPTGKEEMPDSSVSADQRPRAVVILVL